MGFFDLLFGRKTGEKVVTPEQYAAEVEGMPASEIFLKALEAVQENKWQPLSDRPRAWFAIAIDRLRVTTASSDERQAIANALVTHAAGWYRSSSFDRWFEELLRDLPGDLQDATFDEAERRLTGDYDDSVYLELIKRIGGDRSRELFESRRQRWIDGARSDHRPSWEMFQAKCSHLAIVSLKDAEVFLKEAAGIKSVARYGADTTVWKLDVARHMSNVEDAVHYGVSCTAANNGRFSQLADNAEARRSPIPHLVAGHSWSQAEDAYGTNTLYVVRVADDEFVCYDKENYG